MTALTMILQWRGPLPVATGDPIAAVIGPAGPSVGAAQDAQIAAETAAAAASASAATAATSAADAGASGDAAAASAAAAALDRAYIEGLLQAPEAWDGTAFDATGWSALTLWVDAGPTGARYVQVSADADGPWTNASGFDGINTPRDFVPAAFTGRITFGGQCWIRLGTGNGTYKLAAGW